MRELAASLLQGMEQLMCMKIEILRVSSSKTQESYPGAIPYWSSMPVASGQEAM